MTRERKQYLAKISSRALKLKGAVIFNDNIFTTKEHKHKYPERVNFKGR